jgi:hypothetical protein
MCHDDRYSDAVTDIALGDAVLNIKDVTSTNTNHILKLVNPQSGKFQGEVELEAVLMEAAKANSIQQHIVFEYQRYQPIVNWGSDYPGHLLPTDPGRYVMR